MHLKWHCAEIVALLALLLRTAICTSFAVDLAHFNKAFCGGSGVPIHLCHVQIVGAIARTLADFVSYPVRVPQNIQQSSVHPLRDASFPTIVRKVLATDGLGGLYKGIVPQLSQGILGTAIMMALKERTEGITHRVILGAFGAHTR